MLEATGGLEPLAGQNPSAVTKNEPVLLTKVREDMYCFCAGRDMKYGEEAFISYGQKSNYELLLNYGFCLVNGGFLFSDYNVYQREEYFRCIRAVLGYAQKMHQKDDKTGKPTRLRDVRVLAASQFIDMCYLVASKLHRENKNQHDSVPIAVPASIK